MKFMTCSSSRWVSLCLALLALAPLAGVAAESSGVQRAQPLTTPAPKHPYLQRRAGAGAVVTVVFDVTARGAVAHPRIEQTSDRDFNEACLAAIKQWTFAPARKDGQPVETRLRQTFRFSVHDSFPTESPVVVANKQDAR